MDNRYPNLRPQVAGTEECREKARKGAYACNAAKKRKKNMQELCAIMLSQELSGDQRTKLQTVYKGISPDDLTAQAAVIAGQISSAIRGNSMAFAALTQLQRQEEEKRIAIEEKSDKPYHTDLDIIADTFHAAIREVRHTTSLELVLEGGRASGKSSCASLTIIELMENDPDIHCVALRKVANTLKDSVYAQLTWAIREHGKIDEWEFKSSPLEITKKSTGQKIYFRGADKPEKIKSIKVPFGYVGIVWFEELDQFGEEEVRNIEQSVIRGGEKAYKFKTFNPPKSKDSWANKYKATPKVGQLVHHSTYLDVPREWLGEPFLAEAEHLKKVNPDAYEHEYLGVANGAGGNVFTSIELRTITDDDVSHFDRIYQGVDWGIAPDPFCFVRLHYDRDSETIYFIDEHVANGDAAMNRVTADEIIRRGYDDVVITCDSAEKKSTQDFRDFGINAVNARKGAGSVNYGMKWLAGRHIVIDPQRTPFTMEEFTQYEFDRDRDGNLLTGYPDRDNHAIDATRYALERFCNQRFNPA